ncbi:hypothetical protein CGRA01v4_06697 [Colletotrichum graminicola]|nr:hypothetical protein CGRA01v4_06697 [Colletotrichum graminicola]
MKGRYEDCAASRVFCSSAVAWLCLAIIAAAGIAVANVSYMTAGGIHRFSSHFLSRTAVTVDAYKGRCMGSLLRQYTRCSLLVPLRAEVPYLRLHPPYHFPPLSPSSPNTIHAPPSLPLPLASLHPKSIFNPPLPSSFSQPAGIPVIPHTTLALLQTPFCCVS